MICSRKRCGCCSSTSTSREFYRRQFQFILVDEYQDTNKIQADFIDILAGEHQERDGRRRRRAIDLLLARREFPKHSRISEALSEGAGIQDRDELPQRSGNSRSRERGDRSQRAAVSEKFERHARIESVKPALVALNDGSEQAQFVAQRILELRDEGVELNEIAVLYRAHYHAVELQLEFSRRGIPYQITSGIRFFEQAHIKDVAAFIRFVANPRDEVAFKRMVRLLPGIGGKIAENLWNGWEKSLERDRRAKSRRWSERLLKIERRARARAKNRGSNSRIRWTRSRPSGKPNPPSEMIMSVVEAIYDDYAKANFTNYELRREDLNQLAAFARQFNDVQEFLSQLALDQQRRCRTGAECGGGQRSG